MNDATGWWLQTFGGGSGHRAGPLHVGVDRCRRGLPYPLRREKDAGLCGSGPPEGIGGDTGSAILARVCSGSTSGSVALDVLRGGCRSGWVGARVGLSSGGTQNAVAPRTGVISSRGWAQLAPPPTGSGRPPCLSPLASSGRCTRRTRKAAFRLTACAVRESVPVPTRPPGPDPVEGWGLGGCLRGAVAPLLRRVDPSLA